MINTIYGETDYEILPKQREIWERYSKIIRWGRMYPTRFAADFLGIALTDYQKWILDNTWIARTSVLLCSRATGKSFFAAAFMMLRALLFPNYKIAILAPSGGQSAATFSKMEDIALGKISSAIGTSTVFLENMISANSKLTGFTHDRSGNQCKLINGSEIMSLNAVPDNIRGFRTNATIFDEAAFCTPELYQAALPFTAVSADFRTSKNFNAELFPKQLPNINIFLSSASDITSEMYAQYREAFRQMMLGNREYFVADLDWHVSTNPFMDGKPMPPLVSPEEVDRMYKTQPYRAEREQILFRNTLHI